MPPDYDLEYLITAIREYIREIRYFVYRAGIMLSVKALLMTFLLTQPSANVDRYIKLILLDVPLSFIAIAFWFHINILMNSPSIEDFDNLRKHIKEPAPSQAVATANLNSMKELYGTAKSLYSKKNVSMQYANSFFIVGIVSIIIAEQVTPDFIKYNLGTHTSICSAAVFLFALGILAAIKIRDRKFVSKRTQGS